jgi:hypothetical protein
MPGTIFRQVDTLAALNEKLEDMTYVEYFKAFHPKGLRPFKIVTQESQ